MMITVSKVIFHYMLICKREYDLMTRPTWSTKRFVIEF